jgi:hypothetical protein
MTKIIIDIATAKQTIAALERSCELLTRVGLKFENLEGVIADLQQALDKEPDLGGVGVFHVDEPASADCCPFCEALVHTQPEQEPFTHYRHYDNGLQEWSDEKTIPLYTTPPQHSAIARKPLTRDQVKEIMLDDYKTATMQERADFMTGFRAAEAAHGIKE